jgi:hypothetical protein
MIPVKNSKTKSKFLSKSGYILPDIFAEVRSKLLEYQTTSTQLEQLCFWSAELVCSGKVKQLVSMLVDLYCTCFISKDLGFIEKLAKSFRTVSNERFNPRSHDVQAAICVIVIMLARQTPSRNPRSFATSISYSHQCFIDGLQRPTDHASAHVLDVLGPRFVDCDILHILIHFGQSLNEGDASKACCIIDYVTQKNKKICVSGGGGGVLLSITADMPKTIQNDSVWVLWKLLMAANPHPSHKRLVDASFNIFKLEYSAANRRDRLNLLYACAIVITTKKHLSDQAFDDKIIVQALQHLDEIYSSILGKAKKPKSSPANIKSAAIQQPQPQPQASISNDEKMQALFCYAYVTATAAPHHHPPQQPQFKELGSSVWFMESSSK